MKKHLKNLKDETEPACGQKRNNLMSNHIVLTDNFVEVDCRRCKNLVNYEYKKLWRPNEQNIEPQLSVNQTTWT